ncbi:hypothetical protein UFOVP32_53 [uncultured Caudovirales phage]|uniref:HTH_XRE domain containing protein n=1 Tax=uncultured Caudovirales phage TaxID=2100421 RepID=A0A6J5KP68_9CAUD|nr:hypothetical protein UFOVP32_53 [uncultured Caudovirales phage]CAB4123603.1 hypothetical protein UFOVP50_23 [uncultured Caudovirales phage]
MSTINADKRRKALEKWLEDHGHSPYSAAKAAGFAPAAIYNFLSGTSDSLSSRVLEKLAAMANSSVDAILTGSQPHGVIAITSRVGGSGKMFPVDEDEKLTIARPPGVSANEEIAAAIVDGDGLHPIPSGWAVFYRVKPEPASALLGQMAVVRYSGGGERPVIRTIRRGGEPDTFSLQAFGGALIEDVEIVACHRVVAFSQPT